MADHKKPPRRLPEPRKRAREKPQPSRGGADEAGGETAAATPAQQPERWESREESFTFPADSDAPPPSGKLELPSSGLAEDILARESFGELARQAPAKAEPPAAAPAGSLRSVEDAGAGQQFSFFSAAAREEKKAVEATEHLATFFLDREEYGVDVRLVQEIRRVTEITQVPRAPEFVRGVINLRGRIIPVVDLKKKLELGRCEVSPRSRIVVVKLRERLLGLLVDGASQVLKVPQSVIEAAPEEVVEINANYIRGVAKLDKRLIILIDLAKVLELELASAAAGPTS
jgi:purine-binding chemotaxis protein CheW